jgi:hypothetical protein
VDRDWKIERKDKAKERRKEEKVRGEVRER